MIPIKDLNPRHRTPYVTVTLIILNVLAFLYESTLSESGITQFFDQFAIIPGQLTTDFAREMFTPFTAMFLHGGWAHLLGNMVYLWIFGDNIEDRMGHVRFLIFYLVCGLVATAAQVFIDPLSEVPNIGASGAIAGVLGGYLMLYPLVKVSTLIPILLFRRVQLPAVVVLGIWFATQIFSGWSQFGSKISGGGVAYWAHIGGFVAGVILVKLFGSGYRTGRYSEAWSGQSF